METLATEYFSKLYHTDPKVQPATITEIFDQKVSDTDNDALCAEFTDEEINFALFQIGPTKAPGPNGFPACFFQRNWGTLKEDIIKSVRDFFAKGVMPDGINDTAIVLIPKIRKPCISERLQTYQPMQRNI
jgi:hypothetical protein